VIEGVAKRLHRRSGPLQIAGAAMKPKFFPTPEKFRDWLAANHDSAPELLVGARAFLPS
jgi:hypothetical protein